LKHHRAKPWVLAKRQVSYREPQTTERIKPSQQPRTQAIREA
jgi:hypothetical protein